MKWESENQLEEDKWQAFDMKWAKYVLKSVAMACKWLKHWCWPSVCFYQGPPVLNWTYAACLMERLALFHVIKKSSSIDSICYMRQNVGSWAGVKHCGLTLELKEDNLFLINSDECLSLKQNITCLMFTLMSKFDVCKKPGSLFPKEIVQYTRSDRLP